MEEAGFQSYLIGINTRSGQEIINEIFGELNKLDFGWYFFLAAGLKFWKVSLDPPCVARSMCEGCKKSDPKILVTFLGKISNTWVSTRCALWLSGSLELFPSGPLALWLSGSLVLCFYGSLALWLPGSLAL